SNEAHNSCGRPGRRDAPDRLRPAASPQTEGTMSNTLRRVDYFYVMAPNRAGQGAKIMSALAKEGANMLGCIATNGGHDEQYTAQGRLLLRDGAEPSRPGREDHVRARERRREPARLLGLSERRQITARSDAGGQRKP